MTSWDSTLYIRLLLNITMQYVMVDNNKHGLCACISILLVIAGFVGMVVCFSNIDFAELHQSLQGQNTELDDGYMAEEYEQFMRDYGRHFLTSEEKNMRFQIFTKNVQEIRELQNSGKITHTLAINQFADMTKEEFKNYAGLSKRLGDDPVCTQKHTSDTNKADVDWIAKGAVAKVKNQASCGSCYTFSAIAAIEALYFIKGHTLTTFSEQELVDCKYEGNDGCNGGWMDACFDYAMNVGVSTDAQYPYTGRDGKCKNTTVTHVFKITGCKDIPYEDLDALQDALSVNVLSIAVCAECTAFEYYSSGIIKKNCCTDLDHGVALVASGTDAGTAYWRIRNSWGGSWGEKGYLRVLKETGKNKSGMCGIAMAASYPIA
jgi:C1A family cysteine protease